MAWLYKIREAAVKSMTIKIRNAIREVGHIISRNKILSAIISLAIFGILLYSASQMNIFLNPTANDGHRASPHESTEGIKMHGCSVSGYPPRLYCWSYLAPDPSLSISSIVDDLERGSFVYNRITEMRRDDPVTVELKLSVDPKNTPELSRALAGERVEGSISLTPIMSAELRGEAGLIVEPAGRVRNAVSDLAPITWQWTVTPTKAGPDQLLTLSIFLYLQKDGEAYEVLSYEDIIRVDVSIWQRAKDVIKEIQPVWIFVVGAIPALWGGWVFIRSRQWQAAATPRSSPPDGQKPRRKEKGRR